jgi:glucose/arabinose dehydrogenase
MKSMRESVNVFTQGIFLLFLLSCWPANNTNALPIHQIKLPPGFKLSLFASNVPNARSMSLSPNGTLFVGTREAGRVYALLDHNDDNQADELITIARDLHMPNGVAFRNGSLFVAEVSRVLRYDKIETRLHDPPEPWSSSRQASWLEVHSLWAGRNALYPGGGPV